MRTLSAVSIAIVACAAFAGAAQAQSGAEPVSPSVAPTVFQGEPGSASAYAWAGTWFSNHYLGGYVGAMKALNETDDLWSDGFVVRFDASGGSYSYNATGFRNVDVGTLDADVMLGYRKRTGSGTFSIYAGPSYAFHQNPDHAADIRGTQWGAKFLAQYSAQLRDDLSGDIQGSYSTAFDTYSVAGQLLYRVSDQVWLGPQVTLYGNNAPYQESTFGPLMKIMTTFGEIGFSAGYRHVYTSGNPDGYFASVYVGMPIE
jgi:hypothetical protein